MAIAILVAWAGVAGRPGGAGRSDTTADWDELLDRSDVLVLDSETTGLNEQAEIVELAILDTTGAVRFESLIMPRGRIPRAAADVHGITRETLRRAKAPDWPAVHQQVSDLLARAALVLIYNADYDTRLLSQSAGQHGLVLPACRTRCLMLDYASRRRVPGRDGWRWHKLTDAARYEGVPTDGAHRAAADARMTLAIVRAVAGKR